MPSLPPVILNPAANAQVSTFVCGGRILAVTWSTPILKHYNHFMLVKDHQVCNHGTMRADLRVLSPPRLIPVENQLGLEDSVEAGFRARKIWRIQKIMCSKPIQTTSHHLWLAGNQRKDMMSMSY